MTVKVYISLLSDESVGKPVEYEGNLYDLIAHQGLVKDTDDQPISITINGRHVTFSEWEDIHVQLSDDVRIDVIPHGGVFDFIGSIIGGIFKMVFGFLMPSNRNPSSNQGQQGQRLEAASIKANQPRMGVTVPELFGRFKRYGDYLNEPRRYFVNRREQYLEFLVCLTVGRVHIEPREYFIGNTPLEDLGEDAVYAKHEPGTDLSGVSSAQCWHVSREVGGTSSGTAGLELPTELANRENTDPSEYSFTGPIITRSDGSFPTGWGEGTLVQVEYPMLYDITNVYVPETSPEMGDDYFISQITGYFDHVLPLTLGSNISIGPIGSEIIYRVRSFSSGNLRLETMESEPVLFTPGPDQIFIFGSTIQRQIISFSDTSIVINGGEFPSGEISNVRIVFSGGTVYGEWTNPYVATPDGALSSVFEVDFFMPEGLTYIEEDGALSGMSVGVQIEYRDLNNPSVITLATRNYSDSTRDQIGFTEPFTMAAPSRIQVRIRRVGAKSTSTQVMDTVHWYGLKCRLPDVNTYPRWTTMSLRVRSGGKIAMSSENQVSVIGTRILPVLQDDGAWSAEQPTRQIAAAFRQIATTIGYSDSEIDNDELLRLQRDYWTPRNETYDYVLDQTTVKAAMDDMLGAGMSELTLDDGKLRPVRDEPRTAFEQGYSPQNIIGLIEEGFKSHRTDDPDGVVVEYTDSTTWEKETINAFLPSDVGAKTVPLKLNGVTDRVAAWRIGMRYRLIQEYRRWNYSFDTELDGLNSRYLSYVPILNDLREYGQSALVMSATYASSGTIIKSGEPLEYDSQSGYVIAIRDERGFTKGPYPVLNIIDEYTLVATIPESDVPVVTLKQEQPHLYFGESEQWCYPALVQSITPRNGINAHLELVNYDERIYQYDNQSPPE